MRSRTWRSSAAAVVLYICVAFSVASSSAEEVVCRAPEAIKEELARTKTYRDYNRLVCAGLEQLENGAYGDAVESLERAFGIVFHEDENYALYPRLALAYHLDGSEGKARTTLAEAEIAMQLHVGILRCQWDPDGAYVIAHANGMRVQSPYHDGVASRMCSAFSEGEGYEPISLEDYLQKADLVRLYFDVKRVIEK